MTPKPMRCSRASSAKVMRWFDGGLRKAKHKSSEHENCQRDDLMGADSFVVYFGIRQTVQSDEELDLLERRADPRQIAARKRGLRTHLGQSTNGEPHFLLIGAEIGVFGVEGKLDSAISEEAMRNSVEHWKRSLKEAGFDDAPAFIFQVEAQY